MVLMIGTSEVRQPQKLLELYLQPALAAPLPTLDKSEWPLFLSPRVLPPGSLLPYNPGIGSILEDGTARGIISPFQFPFA